MADIHVSGNSRDEFDCDGASDRYLTRLLSGEANGYAGSLTSCTYGGITGTIISVDYIAGNQLWYVNIGWTEAQIIAAGSGLQPFVEVWDGGTPTIRAANICLKDINQDVPFGTEASDSDPGGIVSPLPTVDVGDDGVVIVWCGSGTGNSPLTRTNYTALVDEVNAAYSLTSSYELVVSADAAHTTEYAPDSAGRSYILAIPFNNASASLPTVTGDILPVTINVDPLFFGVQPEPNGMMHEDTPDSGGQLSFTLTTPIDFGTLVYKIDGQFTYTPDSGFVGTASFGYTLYENGIAKPEVTVFIVVEAAVGGGSGAAISGSSQSSGTGTVNILGVGASVSGNAATSGAGTAVEAENVVGSGASVAGPAFASGEFEIVGVIDSVNNPGYEIVDFGGSELEMFIGRDNEIEIILNESGVILTAAQMSGINRMIFQVDDVVLDSDDSSGAFEWGELDGVVTLNYSSMALTAGRHRVRLVVYTVNHTNGVIWIAKQDLTAHCIDPTV